MAETLKLHPEQTTAPPPSREAPASAVQPREPNPTVGETPSPPQRCRHPPPEAPPWPTWPCRPNSWEAAPVAPPLQLRLSLGAVGHGMPVLAVSRPPGVLLGRPRPVVAHSSMCSRRKKKHRWIPLFCCFFFFLNRFLGPASRHNRAPRPAQHWPRQAQQRSGRSNGPLAAQTVFFCAEFFFFLLDIFQTSISFEP